jgi:hypothetical protein
MILSIIFHPETNSFSSGVSGWMTSGRILFRPGKESPEFHQFFLDESFDEIRGKKKGIP